MSAWLPVIVISAAQIVLRLIGAAAVVWRERARAASHCAQMETAASSGTVLGERLTDGTAVLIVPGTACREQVSAAEKISCTLGERLPR